MDLTFAHYRNRFCMFRTYYALAIGKVKADGINMTVIELPDPLLQPLGQTEVGQLGGQQTVLPAQVVPLRLKRALKGGQLVELPLLPDVAHCRPTEEQAEEHCLERGPEAHGRRM